jgi:hypothetical protein
MCAWRQSLAHFGQCCSTLPPRALSAAREAAAASSRALRRPLALASVIRRRRWQRAVVRLALQAQTRVAVQLGKRHHICVQEALVLQWQRRADASTSANGRALQKIQTKKKNDVKAHSKRVSCTTALHCCCMHGNCTWRRCAFSAHATAAAKVPCTCSDEHCDK